MASDDVHPSEMDALTPEELEYALENPDELLVHPVALTLGDLRRSLHSIESPTPGPALAEFLEVTPFGAPSGAEEPMHVPAPAPLRVIRKKKEKTMIGSMTAIAASTAGKILLGSAAAAAAFGAAQATGVVDVTPDDNSAEVVAGAEGDAAVSSTTPLGDVDAAAEAGTSLDASAQADAVRIDAAGAGEVGVAVDQGTLRLTGIASNDGWTGRLAADTDTELVVIFDGDGSSGQVTARISLVADAEVGMSVAVEITDSAGVTTAARFDTSGNLLAGAGLDATIDAGGSVRVGGNVGGNSGGNVDAGIDTGVDAGGSLDGDVDGDLDVDGVIGGAIGGIDDEVDANLDGTVGVESNGNAGLNVDDTGVETDTDLDAGVDVDSTVDGTIDGLDVGIESGAGLDAGLQTGAKTGLSGLLGS